MKRLVGILVLLFLLFSGYSWGQNKAEIEWKSDTAWFVNTKYSAFSSKYELSLILPAVNHPVDCDFARVYWGDGDSTTINKISTDKTLKNTYSTGLFELKIKLYKSDPGNRYAKEDTAFTCMVFNQALKVDFDVYSTDTLLGTGTFRGCMEHGLDTFLVVIDNKKNPPGTQATVRVDTKAPMRDSVIIQPLSEEREDSVYVIFQDPTGTFGADIYVDAEYVLDEDNVLNGLPSQKIPVAVYKRPDLRRIFNFTDTLATGSELKNFIVCAPGTVSELQYSSEINKMYMYSDNKPNYWAGTKRLNFEMTIFRADSVVTSDGKIDWKEVHNIETVDTTKGQLLFKDGGFYKIRMIAYNECNISKEDGKTLIKDTLYTDTLMNIPDKKRYIQVSEGNNEALFCRADTLCLRTVDNWVEFIDTNRRMTYDPVPVYSGEIVFKELNGKKLTGDEAGNGIDRTPNVTIYKGGNEYTEDFSGIDVMGCDSTVIKMQFTLPGTYEFELTKSVDGGCGEITKKFIITIGEPLVMTQDTLLKLMRKGEDIHGDTIELCGKYEYKLPDVGINKGIWGGNMKIDSVMWLFNRGSRQDTTLMGGKDEIINFDSTGNQLNVIRLKAHNYCGWSGADSVKFYTRTLPEVTLWRDSVENNDTLCVNVAYDYHLHGTLPEHFTDSIHFSPKIKIGTGLTDVYEGSDQPKVEGITYPKEGKVIENFTIINTDNKKCFQRFSDTVIAVAQPDTLIYKDSISYCNSNSELNGTKLFLAWPPAKTHTITWTLNGKEVVDSTRIPLKRGTENDTLIVITGSHGGCKLEQELTLIPKPKPDLRLPVSDTICVINPVNIDYIKYAENSNRNKWMQLRIYKDKLKGPSSLLYNSATTDSATLTLKKTDNADTVRLIYLLENAVNIDGSGCSQTDTLLLLVKRPKLFISKKDTLQSPFDAYAFSRLTGKIDTVDLMPGTLEWKGRGLGNSFTSSELYTGSYTLGNTDKAKDSLVFELSAKTFCGDVISDSLIVYIPKIRLHGGTDTICNNVSYTLWGKKAGGEFVDTASLEWKIVKWGSDHLGTLTPSDGKGASVKYTPDAIGRDSVKIAFSAHGQMNTIVTYDTLYLKINPAPVSTLKDTLIAKGRKLNFNGINSSLFGEIENGTFDKSGNVDAIGRWDATTYTMGARPVGAENYSEKIWIGIKGLAGCALLRDTLTLLEVVAPQVVFKSPVEMCSVDNIELNTIYTIKEKDQYTGLSWSLLSGDGAFDADSSHYTSAQQDAKIKLTALKKFKYYDGTEANPELSDAKEKTIIVHSKPIITITADRDSLCNSLNTLTVAQNNFAVKPERYADSLKYQGIGLSGTYPNYVFTQGEGSTAKLVVNVNQGVCKKWKDVSDTLYIYKLLPMKGSFDLDPSFICEDKTSQVKGLSITPAAYRKNYFWTVTGGTLDNADNYPTPTFTPTRGIMTGQVTLHVVPPRACTSADTVTSGAASGIIGVTVLPDIALKDTTICANIGRTDIVFTSQPNINYIDWFVKGVSSSFIRTGSNATYVAYEVKPADVTAGFVDIVAQIKPNVPCATTDVFDTVRLSFQATPVIILPTGLQTVCQGQRYDLSQVSITNQYSINWSAPTSVGSIENNSNFLPSDGYSGGITTLTVKAIGLHGCPYSQKEMPIEIYVAPIPTITASSPICQYGEIDFNTTVTTAAGYSWNFGDGPLNMLQQHEKHTYKTVGDYTVVLTATYANGCARNDHKMITVNEKPVADFTFGSPAAVGSEVVFSNTSRPGLLLSEWTFEDGLSGCNTSNCAHTFSLPSEGTDITLMVTSPAGCKDTATKSIIVVPPPVAEFNPQWDPCKGEVTLFNTSELNHATTNWNFGDGTGSQDPDLLTHTYARYWNDTTFTITLTLTNAAGTRIHQEEIRLVSEIKAEFVVTRDVDGCNSVEKKVTNTSQGRADWYEIHWGDGSAPLHLTSFSPYPEKHTYNNDSNVIRYYPLQMLAHNECGTDTSDTQILQIHPISVLAMIAVDTTYRNECFGHTRGFINHSLGFGGAGFNCEWTFEPGLAFERNNGKEVTHNFMTPGNYTVKLNVSDNCNESSDSVQIRVRGNDSLDFRIQEGPYCAGQEIRMEFVQKGKKVFGEFRWHFADGHVREGKITPYTFDAPGKQQITLKAMSEGCLDEVTHEIAMVHETPVAMISVADNVREGCEPFEVKFHANGGEALNASVLWDFKNEAFSDKRDETNLFKASGSYPVILKLTTPEGCADTAVMSILVKHTPLISFGVNDSLFCTKDGNFTVVLNNTSPDIDISSFSWWKQGERFSIDKQPGQLRFADAHGPVELKLMAVHQENGCPAEFIKTIVASSKVVAKIGMDREEICLETPVHFTNDSENSGLLAWNLGDGTKTGEAAFDHIYGSTGLYTISLVAWNEDGCVDSMVRQMTVYPLPTADFTFEKDNSVTGLSDTLDLPELDNGGIRFRNLSYVSPQTWGNNMKAYWDFKDGKTSVEWAPYHKFDSNGIYNVLLRVTTEYGCEDSLISSESVAIKTIKGLFIPTAFAPVQADEGVNRFKPVGVGLHRYKIQVYDFRGTCVWSSTKLENGGRPAEWWDGTFNGAPVQSGNYLWKASGIFIDGSVWEGNGGATEGSVMLIR